VFLCLLTCVANQTTYFQIIVNCMGQCTFEIRFKYSVCLPILQKAVIFNTKCTELTRVKSAYYSDYIVNKSVRVTQGNK